MADLFSVHDLFQFNLGLKYAFVTLLVITRINISARHLSKSIPTGTESDFFIVERYIIAESDNLEIGFSSAGYQPVTCCRVVKFVSTVGMRPLQCAKIRVWPSTSPASSLDDRFNARDVNVRFPLYRSPANRKSTSSKGCTYRDSEACHAGHWVCTARETSPSETT